MFAGKMRKRRRPFVPADKQDTRKLTAEEREKLRRKAVLLYKRENPVPVIARKLGIRPATVYRWIENYLNEGPIKYRENKRGRRPLDPSRLSTWQKWVREQRAAYQGSGKWVPALPGHLDLYKGKEFLEWCRVAENYKIIYLLHIRRQLEKLGINEDDAGSLSDLFFLWNQYMDPQFGEIGWKVYCLFLLGGEYGIPKKKFIRRYCNASILENLSQDALWIYNEYSDNPVKKSELFNNAALYRGKEFFKWCSELPEEDRYVYYFQIRRKLDELRIGENDSSILQDRDFVKSQYYRSSSKNTGWMKYCMFLLGKPFEFGSKKIWFKGI